MMLNIQSINKAMLIIVMKSGIQPVYPPIPSGGMVLPSHLPSRCLSTGICVTKLAHQGGEILPPSNHGIKTIIVMKLSNRAIKTIKYGT